MARPSAFDRQAAIDLAMHELWRSGYEATSVKAMSERLGITRSSYYNAFGSREGLFKEALELYLAQSPHGALLEEPSDGAILPLISGTFRTICAVRANDPEHRGCLAVNCVGELGTSNEPGRLCTEAIMASANRLEELLRLAVERGEISAETDTRTTALALQSLMVGINTLAKAVHDFDVLWMTAKTTLRGLGLYQEVGDA